MDAKLLLSEILSFYKYKVDNNLCTPSEIESAAKVLQENMEMYGTIADFARFYDTSEQNVRTTINRKLIDKPKRKVLYPFHKFVKIVQSKWLLNRGKDKIPSD
jgi:hypothetical protein